MENYLAKFSEGLENLKSEIENIQNIIKSTPSDLFLSQAQGHPGYVVPYHLEEEDCLDVPLTSVTELAIQESGTAGPLDANALKNLLSENFDRRYKTTFSVIKSYSKDVRRVKSQLEDLKSRIIETESVEQSRNQSFLRKVKYAVRALAHFDPAMAESGGDTVSGVTLSIIPGYELPNPELIEELLTPASILALKESGKHGPLNEVSLMTLLADKLSKRWQDNLLIVWQHSQNPEGLRDQLQNLRDHMDMIQNSNNFKLNFLMKQISKVLKDIDLEV